MFFCFHNFDLYLPSISAAAEALKKWDGGHSSTGPALGMFEVFGRTGPQNLEGRNFGPCKNYFASLNDFATNCNADRRRTNIVATRCVLRACNTAKCNCVRGSPRTPLGELTALPNPYRPQGRPPTQNFGWVGHNTFRHSNNFPIHSLTLFANSLKLVPLDVGF